MIQFSVVEEEEKRGGWRKSDGEHASLNTHVDSEVDFNANLHTHTHTSEITYNHC